MKSLRRSEYRPELKLALTLEPLSLQHDIASAQKIDRYGITLKSPIKCSVAGICGKSFA